MEIRINGILIDTDGAVVAISKQGLDFSDLKKRFLGRTNQFSLPRTSKNRRVFGAPDILNSSSRSFEVFYNVTVEDQGVVTLKGTGILTDAGQDYKLQVIDSAKDLFDAMSSKLSDLDLDAQDFVFNQASYALLKTYDSNDSIWIWPFDLQYTTNDYTKSLFDGDLHYSRPHFRADKLIEASLLAQGWVVEGFDSAGVDFSAISSNHDNFYVTGYESFLNFTITEGNIMDTIAASVFIAPTYYADGVLVGMPGNPTSYRMRGSIEATSDFTIRITATSHPLGTDVIVSDFLVGENDTFIDFITTDFETGEAENRVTFEAIGTGNLTFNGVKLYSRIEEDSFGDLSGGLINVGVLSEYKVKVFENMPDITQLDLLRELWTLFAFDFNINQATRVISVYPIGDISRVNTVDWSEKFIKDSDVISLSGASLGKKTFLEYNNDETVNNTTGAAFFDVDNDTLNNEETYLSSSFSASETVDFLNSPTIPVPVAVMRIYNETERENNITPRVKKITLRPAQAWKTEATFTSLEWGALKNAAYAVVFTALQKGRYIKASFDLNKVDVIGVDFSSSIYIDQLKSYFILSLINNYIPGQLTSCELLKIN